MKRLLIALTLFLPTLVGGQAQTIQNGSNWFDGQRLYTAKVEGSKVTMTGRSASQGGYRFYLEKVSGKAGEYFLDDRNEADNLNNVRGKAGWRATYIRQEGMYFLVVRNRAGDAVWEATLTPDNLEECLAQQADVKKPTTSTSFLLQHWLMNTDYLSSFSKQKLRLMRNEILAHHGYRFQSDDLQEYFGSKSWYKPGNNNGNIKLSIIEQTNIQLIKSEEAIPDVQRTNWVAKSDTNAPITVDNALAFMKALGSNRTIFIAENTEINLSEVLDDETLSQEVGIERVGYDLDGLASGNEGLYATSVFDGHQLTLTGIHNLTIRGDLYAQIVVHPRYSFVLNFVGCDNITIDNLTLGHTDEGYCEGGVIGLATTNNVNIKDCDLYGCGTYGIVALNCSRLNVESTIIRDCSYGIMELRMCDDVTFRKCDFYRNREFGLVTVGGGCNNINFNDCRWAENKGSLFVLGSKVRMVDCDIHHAGDMGAINGNIEENNVSWGTDDDELPYRSIGTGSMY